MTDRAVVQAYDEATVVLLRATSSAAALMVADADERSGLPAYSDTPGIDPRQDLFVCVARGCGQRYWSSPEYKGGVRVCCDRCKARWHWDNNPAIREAQRVRYAALRAV